MFNPLFYPFGFASLNRVSPPGSVGASALSCRGLHRRPAPLATRGGDVAPLIVRGAVEQSETEGINQNRLPTKQGAEKRY